MSVKLIIIIILIFSLSRYALECNGQEQYSFRQHVINGEAFLQIFYISDTDGSGTWYNIRLRGVDYRETYYACRNLSDTAMVEFTGMENGGGFERFYLRCNTLPEDVSGCDRKMPDDIGQVVQLTCLNYNEYNEGDLLQLEDGRIIQLVEFSNGRFVWAHYCFDDNNWGVTEANLACQSLGFDRVKGGREKIELGDKRVYGLISIDCSMADSMSQCISTPVTNNARCDDDSVIAIECENIPTLPNSQTSVTSASGVGGQSVTVTAQNTVSQTIRTGSNYNYYIETSSLPPVPISTALITAVIALLSLCIVLTLIGSLMQIFGIILIKIFGGYITKRYSNEYQTDQIQKQLEEATQKKNVFT